MSSSEVSRLMGLITQPWWKLWVTQGRKERAAQELVKLGKVAVPALIKEYTSSATPNSVVEEALVSLGEVATEDLVEVAQQTNDALTMQRLASVFEKMGPAARSAIPVLLKWARLRKDPRLESMRHLTGDAALDRAITQRIGLPSEKPMEGIVMTWVRQRAAEALIKMGPALVPFLDELRAMKKSETDEICRGDLGRAIKAAGG